MQLKGSHASRNEARMCPTGAPVGAKCCPRGPMRAKMHPMRAPARPRCSQRGTKVAKMHPVQGIIRFFLILGCPGGVPKERWRHEDATLWELGKTAFCEKSDAFSLVLVGFRDLWSSGPLVEGFREDKSSPLVRMCVLVAVQLVAVQDGLTRLLHQHCIVR